MQNGGYSQLDIQAQYVQERLKLVEEMQGIGAFPLEERSPVKSQERRSMAQGDYTFFKRTYFPAEMFGESAAPDNRMQRAIPVIAQTQGLHWVLGARNYGKSSEMLITLTWLVLTGRVKFPAMYSETLPKAWQRIDALHTIFTEHPRIVSDWTIETIKFSTQDEYGFRINGIPGKITARPYSEDRSVRGAMKVFERPDFLWGDDVETESSPMDESIVAARRRKIEEAYKSLKRGSTAVFLANNFHEDCVANLFLKLSEEDKLKPNQFVHIFAAWDEELGALWNEVYPAESEEELQLLHEADDEEWSGNYQQRPKRKGGRAFPEEFLTTYPEAELPKNAIGVAWCDPNLALKVEVSDTTAFGALLYSPSTNCYYVHRPRCLAYSDSDELLSSYLALYDPARIIEMGFDGNVDQEATWSNFVSLWCKVHKRPYPQLAYKKYTVDMHIKTVQLVWKSRRILLPAEYLATEEGQKFLRQIVKFISKKRRTNKQKVDAADWLICAFLLIHDPDIDAGEGGMNNDYEVSTIEKSRVY